MSLSADEFDLVLQAGCCMAAIDGHLTRSEMDSIVTVLAAIGAPQATITDKNILAMARRVHNEGTREIAAHLRQQLTWTRTSDAIIAITKICDAMKAATPSDKKRLSQIMVEIIPPGREQQESAPHTAGVACRPMGSGKAATRYFRAFQLPWLNNYATCAPLALVVLTIGFRLEIDWRAQRLWGLSDGQRAVLAILSAVAMFFAVNGLMRSYVTLQNSRGGAAVPPAVGFCVCLYVIWRSFF